MGDFAVDLHVHTTAGSADASLRAAELGTAATAVGLSAVMTAEHLRQWSGPEAEAIEEQHGLRVFPAREWSTPLGHILAIGVQQSTPDMRDPATLRAVARSEGGLLVAAHPFRHFFDGPRQGIHPSTLRTEDPEEAATMEIFQFVDAIEGVNGNCSPRENDFARAVAACLDLPVTAGSDAHYAVDLGRCWTILPAAPASVKDLIALIRDGRSRVVAG